MWFKSQLSPSVCLDSLAGTHWRPAFFPSREPMKGRIDFRLRYEGKDRFTWDFNGRPPQGSLLGDDLVLAQLSLGEDTVPRLPPSRRKVLRALPWVDGRRTVSGIARRLKGMPYAEAVRWVKSLCLNENLTW